MSGRIVLRNVRLSFPDIFRATAFNEGDAAKFKATFLFPKDHPAKALVGAAIKEAAKEKWGAKADAILKAIQAKDALCLHDGNSKPDYEGYEGMVYVSASNKVKPTIRDADGTTDLVESDGKPYGGCFVNAHIEIYAQDNKWGKRVNATLRGIQFVEDGDAFSASPPAKDDEFDDLTGGEAAGNDAVGEEAEAEESLL